MGFTKVFISLMLMLVLVAPISAQDCYESSIISPYPFMGNHGEVFKLSDGSQWKVVQERISLFLYEYYPKILICPDNGQLMVGGKILNVEKNVPESSIPSVSPFNGAR